MFEAKTPEAKAQRRCAGLWKTYSYYFRCFDWPDSNPRAFNSVLNLLRNHLLTLRFGSAAHCDPQAQNNC